MKTILILNGPNLNRLGTREPDVYGHETLDDLEDRLSVEAETLDVAIECRQSNHEGVLIDAIHEAADKGFAGIVFNPGAYTHTSIALRDAIAATEIPVVEVHLSNLYQRESFRHHSYTAGVSEGVISGLGIPGYCAALRYLARRK